MYRFCIVSVVLAALVAAASPSDALKLLAPTKDQVVRENVKITIPLSDLPAEFIVPKGENPPEGRRPFISVVIVSGGVEKLVAAMSPDTGKVSGSTVSFLWDSKAPYSDKQDAREERFWKDGRYTLKVDLYNGMGSVADSATVDIELKNRIARPNPPPAVSLANRLVFGESHAYGIHAEVQVFHVVNNTGLPIIGGMGMTSDFKIIQSVEDKRPDGSYLLRCRMDPEGYLSSFGQRARLFATSQPKPQLYRLVDKYGNVLKRNVFSRQGMYTMMDVLPTLPNRSVKEGQAWPTAFDLKVEGITGVIPLSGTSTLDSFEWQDGQQCAKIVSMLKGASAISMDNGRIRSSSAVVSCDVITYFAYRTGKMVRREIILDFPALIMPGAGEIEGSAATTPDAAPSGATTSPYMPGSDRGVTAPGGLPPYGAPSPGGSGTTGTKTEEAGAKKGSVQVKVVVRLEK